MKNVNVLFTNPPYHSLNEDGKAVGRLWWYIVAKSLEDKPERAMLIVPSSFHSPGAFQTSRYKLTKLLNMGYHITHLQSDVCKRFNNVSIPISYINLSREVPEVSYIHGHPFPLKNNLLDGRFPIPFYASKNSCNVIRKCFNDTDPLYDWKGQLEDGFNPESYAVVLESGRFGYYDNRHVGKLKDCTVYGETIFYNKNDHDSVVSIFGTKLYRYMFRTMGGESQQSRSASIRYCPRLSTDRIWTDEEVYEKFDLSDEEIDEIEQDAATKYKRWM
tara:strand:+ start:1861 stop:2682 length:822 start_codon:yes stop_codon:yes gene_type:complete